MMKIMRRNEHGHTNQFFPLRYWNRIPDAKIMFSCDQYMSVVGKSKMEKQKRKLQNLSSHVDVADDGIAIRKGPIGSFYK